MRFTFSNPVRFIAASAALLASGIANDCAVTLPLQAAELVVADQVFFNNPAGGAIEQQLRAQFEPILKVELSFANRVCSLTDSERRKLIGSSNKWLDSYIKDYAQQGGQVQPQGVWFGGGPVQQPADPRQSIINGVGELVKKELPKEKTELYADECKKRTDFVQRMAVAGLVTRIDKELILSGDQRDKLTKSLEEHWDKSWTPQMEMIMHGMEMWPAVPDKWIIPHLSAAQQAAWSRITKQSGNMFFGGIGIAGGEVIDDIDLKEGQDENNADVADADAADAKKADAAIVFDPKPEQAATEKVEPKNAD